MNYFHLLPLEVLESIFIFIPDLYFFFTINIVNQTWNQMIMKNYSRRRIKNKYLYPCSSLFIAYPLYEDLFSYMNTYEIKLMNQLFFDRQNNDVIPVRL